MLPVSFYYDIGCFGVNVRWSQEKQEDWDKAVHFLIQKKLCKSVKLNPRIYTNSQFGTNTSSILGQDKGHNFK